MSTTPLSRPRPAADPAVEDRALLARIEAVQRRDPLALGRPDRAGRRRRARWTSLLAGRGRR